MNKLIKFKLVSIDAWSDCDGWTWNTHYLLEEGIFISEELITPRRIARYLREWGYLTEESKGRIRLDMGESYADWFIEIQDKNTGEPLLALTTIH